jgi:hypothetical protein
LCDALVNSSFFWGIKQKSPWTSGSLKAAAEKATLEATAVLGLLYELMAKSTAGEEAYAGLSILRSCRYIVHPLFYHTDGMTLPIR